MAFLQWRRFNFFERNFLNEPNNSFIELAKSFQITCSSSGNGYLILGDITGLVHLVSRQYRTSSFAAHNIAVTHCCAINNRINVSSGTTTSNNSKFHIVTIGTDSEDLVPVLKVWRINESALIQTNEANMSLQSVAAAASIIEESVSEQAASPPIGTCIRSIRLAQNNLQCSGLRMHASVTVLDVFQDSLIAVGFNDGHCLIVRGELTRDRNIKTRLLKVSTNGDSSVTGVAFSSYTRSVPQNKSKTFRTFAGPNNGSHTRQVVILFVSTRNEICLFDLSNREESKLVLDTYGCEVGCSCLKRDPKQLESIQFIVGRNDAIYFYNADDRGPCLAYDGQKVQLYWFRNYLVVITANDLRSHQESDKSHCIESPYASSASGGDSAVLNNPNPCLITIYDIARKFIAFSCPIPALSQVVSEWGHLYILTADGRVCVFTECDTQTKLELLFRKNQFSLAIDLAKAQTYSQDSLKEMFKQYGDHLYANGDFDGAIAQYCQTIGLLEPSYVIRKFLDLQRIHNLTLYLQELHKHGLATEDHTTLLINCYVKLKDEQKLNEFLRSSDLVFDVEIGIRVLRQAGYYDNACMLAKRHSRYDSYFSILLEDKSDSTSVLETFQELLNESKENIVSHFLCKYGRLLMTDQPDKTTELLKALCSHMFRHRQHKTRPISQSANKSTECLFDMDDLAATLETGQDSYVFDFQPEKYLHIFLNHPSKLIEYLEFVIAESKSAQNSDGNTSTEISFEISNTLLEMYLHSYKNEIKEDGLAENEAKIMKFLQSEDSHYDAKKAMILCQMSNFTPGVLYLYEKSRMFKQILTHFIARKESAMVIDICNKYGDEEPSLWMDALCHFSEIYTEEHQANTLIVLQQIEKRKLLPPLMVIEILSKHGKVTLGMVREYLMRWIKTEQSQIEKNERLIESYREECDKIRIQIEDIRDKPRVFQASKCAACSHVLDLPSVHFMCGHSYHHTCFESYIAENEHDCPLCLPQNRKILNEISMFDNVTNVGELFQQELSESKDPFEVIARYCSQGLFNPLTVVTDEGLIQTQRANKPL